GAPARRRGVLIIIIFLILIVGVVFAIEAWLVARALHNRHRRARPGFAADHAANAGLPAQQRMHDHAEPGRGVIALVCFSIVFVVALARGRFFIVVRGT